MQDPQEDRVDGRVEGAIETLNSAIAALNTLEDTRSAAAAAASRAAALVRDELADLELANARLHQRILPFSKARAAAVEAIEAAKDAEAGIQEFEAAEAAAKEAYAGTQRYKEQRPWQAQAKQDLEEARKATKEAKQRAKRANKLAEDRAVKLGELGEGLEKAGYQIPRALQEYSEYLEQHAGLQEVLKLHEARLSQLELEKDAATEGVGEAMGSLEALSTELHEQKDQSLRHDDHNDQSLTSGSHSNGSHSNGPHSNGSHSNGSHSQQREQPQGEGGMEAHEEVQGTAAIESSAAQRAEVGAASDAAESWRADSMWRSLGSLPGEGVGDSEDSFAGQEWSEADDSNEEEAGDTAGARA